MGILNLYNQYEFTVDYLVAMEDGKEEDSVAVVSRRLIQYSNDDLSIGMTTLMCLVRPVVELVSTTTTAE